MNAISTAWEKLLNGVFCIAFVPISKDMQIHLYVPILSFDGERKLGTWFCSAWLPTGVPFSFLNHLGPSKTLLPKSEGLSIGNKGHQHNPIEPWNHFDLNKVSHLYLGGNYSLQKIIHMIMGGNRKRTLCSFRSKIVIVDVVDMFWKMTYINQYI